MPAICCSIVFAALFFVGGGEEEAAKAEEPAAFDAFAGGYPVPPMPGQVLPELTNVIPSTAEPQGAAGEEQ